MEKLILLILNVAIIIMAFSYSKKAKWYEKLRIQEFQDLIILIIVMIDVFYFGIGTYKYLFG